MVREITMFELHFDGARFGPSFGSDDEDETSPESETESEADAEESGGSKLRPVLALIGVVLVVTALRRLAKRRSGEDYDIPLGEESEAVTAEQ